MTRCNRCGRALKAPTDSGFGPTCERYVLGSKPKRAATVEPPPVERDELTPDMFDPMPWLTKARAVLGIGSALHQVRRFRAQIEGYPERRRAEVFQAALERDAAQRRAAIAGWARRALGVWA